MARVNFSAAVESIVGKLAGSVFQDSYGGFQVRTRVSPRNSQTPFQQLRRGQFGYITQLWRTLTQAQRNTWIAASSTPPAAFNLFIKSNVNLSLLNIPPAPSFIAAATPATFDIRISALDESKFSIIADSALTIVPVDTELIIFSTYAKGATKIFTNPGQYSPIAILPAGTDLSTPYSVLAAWQSRFGQLTVEERLCVKSALVSSVNGGRTESPPNCSLINQTDSMTRLFTNLAEVGTGTGARVLQYQNTIPANTLVNNGDTITVEIAGSNSSNTLTFAGLEFDFAAAGSYAPQGQLTLSASGWKMLATLVRIDATTIQASFEVLNDGQTAIIERLEMPFLDLTIAFKISAFNRAPIGDDIRMFFGIINLQTV